MVRQTEFVLVIWFDDLEGKFLWCLTSSSLLHCQLHFMEERHPISLTSLIPSRSSLYISFLPALHHNSSHISLYPLFVVFTRNFPCQMVRVRISTIRWCQQPQWTSLESLRDVWEWSENFKEGEWWVGCNCVDSISLGSGPCKPHPVKYNWIKLNRVI